MVNEIREDKTPYPYRGLAEHMESGEKGKDCDWGCPLIAWIFTDDDARDDACGIRIYTDTEHWNREKGKDRDWG